MTRFYRALLRLYPASFRADYGDELTRTFKEQTHYRSRASAAGTFVAYLAARGMSTLLFGVRPDDPATISLVALVCFVTTVAACARPASRAARIHPISVLRSD